MEKLTSKLYWFAMFTLSLFVAILLNTSIVSAQSEEELEGEDEEYVDENLKYMKPAGEDYIEIFNVPFPKVFDACKRIVLDWNGCRIVNGNGEGKIITGDDGLSKGLIKSEMCILTANKDTCYIFLKKYTFKPPFIRGGVWNNFRSEYKISLTEEEKDKVQVKLELILSGFEELATYKVHFFKTNGWLEHLAFEKIAELIKQ